MFKKTRYLLMLGVLLMACGAVFAGEALRGYDPVAYFMQGNPQKGNSQYQTEWNGSTWSFASAENKKMFESNPEKYAPQYGGFCAFGVSKGSKAPSDPNAWTIVNGKLYLNYNSQVKSMWEQNRDANIQQADQNWKKL